MNTLTLLVGIPGSGKSTYAEKIVDENNLVFSSDSIRKELFENESSQENNVLVFNTLFSRAKNAILNGKNVIIDATNITKNNRKKVLDNFLGLKIKRVAIVFKTPKNVCIKRDKNRSRIVGQDIIEKFSSKFEMPSKDEGFDEIIFIN